MTPGEAQALRKSWQWAKISVALIHRDGSFGALGESAAGVQTGRFKPWWQARQPRSADACRLTPWRGRAPERGTGAAEKCCIMRTPPSSVFRCGNTLTL